MAEYQVAIIGSGPAGTSAACRAAELGLRHILLERAPHLSNTISKYQKGKYIMSTPDRLPLRAAVPFEADTREAILEKWAAKVTELKVNLRTQVEVTGITGEKGNFTIQMANGDVVTAESVVLAIGVQGNLRKLGVPGEDNGLVHYQLDDPKDYWDKDIVVVGAGDAGIENAVALAQNENRVTIVNRMREFVRVKPGNISLILSCIKDELIDCVYNGETIRIEPNAIVLKTPDGERIIRADRVIARLGGIPPRKFIESVGGVFEDGADFPRVNESYECDRPGLYIIGALAGYPLIKHCLNQGYEVVQTIAGKPVDGPDIGLLAEKFKGFAAGRPVHEVLGQIKNAVPLFSGLTILQLREFLLDAELEVHQPGSSIIVKGQAGDSLFLVLQGTVDIPVAADKVFHLPVGAFFGEMGLIMGRRRAADALAGQGGAVVIEIPRMAALKLLASSAPARKMMNDSIVLRKLQTFLSADLTAADLAPIIETYQIKQFARGEALITEGAEADAVYVLQSGSCAVSRNVAGQDVVINYVPAGSLLGEMALLYNTPRNATVRAAVGVEAIRIDGAQFRDLMERKPHMRSIIERIAEERTAAGAARSTADDAKTRVTEFLMQNGIGEATNAIVIDNKLCIRCDVCETACAETHDGIPRLDRDAGPTYADVHIPISCRHCEHPHCMADCPPNALYRTASGAVTVNDSCIGCGNCVRNCPYDAIRLSAKPKKRGNILTWLLFGAGDAPGERAKPVKSKENKEVARKCDLCETVTGGPACVRACPTGAVIRIGPEQLLTRIQEDR